MSTAVKKEVVDILEKMIDGRKNISKSCAALSALRLGGCDFIYQDFDELYSQLQHYPLPEQYHQWNNKVLAEKLMEVERLHNQALALSLQLLEELT